MHTPPTRHPLIVNYGLGADSTAWLLLLLDTLPRRGAASGAMGDPAALARLGLPDDADLDRITVVTAMTGSEHPDTIRLAETHLLPRMAAAGLRYVQVARPHEGKEHTVAVLDDSTAPARLHTDGRLRLFTEMTRAGTVPTTGGARKCSIKAKGWPIDAFLRFEVGGRRFYQVMGFEDSKHERGRAARDARDGAKHHPDRVGVYPLITLGWDRARCLAYIQEQTGAAWRKSACGFCLAGETEVVTRDGVRAIRDLAGGMHELLIPQQGTRGGLMHRGSFKPVEVKSFGTQRLYRVELRRFRASKVVYATAEHRWFLAAERGAQWVDSTEFERTTSELRTGDRLRPLQATAPGKEPLAPFAVAQGFVFGDGSRLSGRNAPASLTIYNNGKDEAMLPFFAACDMSKEKRGTTIRGLPRFWKDIPPIRESRTFLLSWLAGYFAADGTVSENGSATLYSANRANIEYVRSIAAVCGVGHSPIRTRLRKGFGDGPTMLHQINLTVRDLPDWFFLIKEHARRIEACKARNDGRMAPSKAWKVVQVVPTGRVEEVFCAVVPGAQAFGLADDLMTGNCPFRTTNKAGLAEVLDDWRATPGFAVEALVMDYAAVALNPQMGLVGGTSLWATLDPHPGLDAALRAADAHLDGLRWGVYEVRRGLKAKPLPGGGDDPARRGFTARETRRVASGTRTAMRAALEAAAVARGLPVDRTDPRHPRVWVERRADTFPTREHLLVAAPAFVDAKTGPGFAAAWTAVEQAPPPAAVQLPLAVA